MGRLCWINIEEREPTDTPGNNTGLMHWSNWDFWIFRFPNTFLLWREIIQNTHLAVFFIFFYYISKYTYSVVRIFTSIHAIVQNKLNEFQFCCSYSHQTLFSEGWSRGLCSYIHSTIHTTFCKIAILFFGTLIYFLIHGVRKNVQ